MSVPGGSAPGGLLCSGGSALLRGVSALGVSAPRGYLLGGGVVSALGGSAPGYPLVSHPHCEQNDKLE